MLAENNHGFILGSLLVFTRPVQHGSHFVDLFSFSLVNISWSLRKRLSRSFSSNDPQIDFNISFSGGDIEFKSVPNQHLFYNSLNYSYKNLWCLQAKRRFVFPKLVKIPKQMIGIT